METTQQPQAAAQSAQVQSPQAMDVERQDSDAPAARYQDSELVIIQIGKQQESLTASMWSHHSDQLKTRILARKPDDRAAILVQVDQQGQASSSSSATPAIAPEALGPLAGLLRVLGTDSERGEIKAPLPRKPTLDTIYLLPNKTADHELIKFLQTTFPLPWRSPNANNKTKTWMDQFIEENALIADTMNLCNRLGMKRALTVFANYYAFVDICSDNAQRNLAPLPKIDPPVSKSSSSPSPKPGPKPILANDTVVTASATTSSAPCQSTSTSASCSSSSSCSMDVCKE